MTWTKKVSNFQTDLQKGLLGQQLLLKAFKSLEHIDGLKGDLLAPCGSKVECKADFYGMNKSSNWFMERYGSIESGKAGGAWLAKEGNCKYFIYFYVNELTGFVWHTDDLVSQLEPIIANLKPVEIRNRTWTTVGYKVPRSLTSPLFKFTLKEVEVLDETAKEHIIKLVNSWGFRGKIS